MNTEITDTIKGWIYYDADCALCSHWAHRSHAHLARRGFHLVPFQEALPPEEMKLVTVDGLVFGGADAVVKIAGAIWWLWPAFVAAQIPGMNSLARRGYKWIAKRRHCTGNHCKVRLEHAELRHHHGARSFYEMP